MEEQAGNDTDKPAAVATTAAAAGDGDGDDNDAPKHVAMVLQCELTHMARISAYVEGRKGGRGGLDFVVEESTSLKSGMQQGFVFLHGLAHDVGARFLRDDKVLRMPGSGMRRVYFVERRARRLATLVDRVVEYHPELCAQGDHPAPRLRVVAFPRPLEAELVGLLAAKGVHAAVSGDCDLVLFVLRRGNKLSLGVTPSSLLITPESVAAPRNPGEDGDGAGGAGGADAEAVSRAMYKLEELVGRDMLSVVPGQRFVDLGASPGGWTQALCSRGARVWSVDPAPLAISPAPSQHHHTQAKAEDVVADVARLLQADGERLGTDALLDGVVCDVNMRWDTAWKVCAPYLPLLRRGGVVVMTCKGTERKDLKRHVDGLRGAMEEAGCVGLAVVHLFSNTRNERTLVGTLNPDPKGQGQSSARAEGEGS